MLFSKPIDSLAAAGSILASVWLDGISMPVVDNLGDDFLEAVKTGDQIEVKENGIVVIH
jgi:predicted aconitase with swiveling domain